MRIRKFKVFRNIPEYLENNLDVCLISDENFDNWAADKTIVLVVTDIISPVMKLRNELHSRGYNVGLGECKKIWDEMLS